MLPYSELMDWQNAAEFVANYVDLELLSEPTELVRIIDREFEFYDFFHF